MLIRFFHFGCFRIFTSMSSWFRWAVSVFNELRKSFISLTTERGSGNSIRRNQLTIQTWKHIMGAGGVHRVLSIRLLFSIQHHFVQKIEWRNNIHISCNPVWKCVAENSSSPIDYLDVLRHSINFSGRNFYTDTQMPLHIIRKIRASTASYSDIYLYWADR